MVNLPNRKCLRVHSAGSPEFFRPHLKNKDSLVRFVDSAPVRRDHSCQITLTKDPNLIGRLCGVGIRELAAERVKPG